MKIVTRWSATVLICLLICSCATHSVQLMNQGNVNSPIEMQKYKILLKDDQNWKDWALTKKNENDSIIIETLRITKAGRVKGQTTILVTPITVNSPEKSLSFNQLANKLRDEEETLMVSQTESKNGYEFSNINKSDRKVGRKKVYLMNWEASKGTKMSANFRWTPFVKGALYIYFPNSYHHNNTLYKFVITESYVPLTMGKIDVDKILPIIEGFSTNMN